MASVYVSLWKTCFLFYYLKRNNAHHIRLGLFVKVIRARKKPGLLSFIISLHNIIYRRESPFADEVLEDIGEALVAIEKRTDYSWSDNEWELKRNLEIRSQAAALAFRVYIYEEKCGKGKSHSDAMNLWSNVCCGIRSKDEFAEVRNAWILVWWTK